MNGLKSILLPIFAAKKIVLKDSSFNSRLLYILFFLLTIPGYSQDISFGLKAGLGYTVNETAAEIEGSAGYFSADSKIGVLAGAFAEVGFGRFFVRPEVFYNQARAEFPFPDPSNYTVEKIMVPVLLGYNIIGPLDIYAGPSYQYTLDMDLENVPEGLVNLQNNWAFQAGVKVGVNRFELGLRYSYIFDSSENQVITINNLMERAFFDDGRLNQFMLSISYKIFDSANPRQSRKANCYF